MEEKNSNEKLNHVTEEEKNARLLDRAFAVIREHIDRGHRFSFDQMDTGIEISLPVLPKPEQDLFKEIARHNHVSLWQAIWAQFRRAHENGMSFALILDPGWKSGDIYSLSPIICEECNKTFTPKRFGERFCSNKCGAEEERARLGLPTIEEQLTKIKEDEAKKGRAVEADQALRGQHKAELERNIPTQA